MTTTDLEPLSPWSGETIAIVAATTVATCEHCQKPFGPRRAKTQRFCSSTCRKANHNSRRSENKCSPASTFASQSASASQPKIEASQEASQASEAHGETPEPATKRLIGLPPDHDKTRPAPKPEPEFDWNDKDSVVLVEQLPIAVYIGKHGHLVIRQRADRTNERHDTVILIAPQSITEFVDKLTRLPPRGRLP
jgi:hypothetical protein